jgi:hypothetical protein
VLEKNASAMASGNIVSNEYAPMTAAQELFSVPLFAFRKRLFCTANSVQKNNDTTARPVFVRGWMFFIRQALEDGFLTQGTLKFLALRQSASRWKSYPESPNSLA